MPIASMTGFARAEGEAPGCTWSWELRSVNSRGLDVRCRLPSGFEGLEPSARQRLASRLRRGSVTVTLNVTWTAGRSGVRINTDVLERIFALIAEVQARLPDAAPPRVDGVLGLRGVIDVEDASPSGDERAALDAALLDGLERGLDALTAVRCAEGERLRPALAAHLAQIEALSARARQLAALQPEALLARLREQVSALLDAVPALPVERIAQEAALLAVRADAREELDRLHAHGQAARQLLDSGAAIGRQLDFLCQEFNREANTLCSKSADVELTQVGLELKATIDQLREQVQNIE